MTIILTAGDSIYYYFGITDPKVEITNFSKDGIRKILLEKNAPQIQQINLLKMMIGRYSLKMQKQVYEFLQIIQPSLEENKKK